MGSSGLTESRGSQMSYGQCAHKQGLLREVASIPPASSSLCGHSQHLAVISSAPSGVSTTCCYPSFSRALVPPQSFSSFSDASLIILSSPPPPPRPALARFAIISPANKTIFPSDQRTLCRVIYRTLVLFVSIHHS